MSGELAESYTKNIVERAYHYTGERPLFDLHGVEGRVRLDLSVPDRFAIPAMRNLVIETKS